MKTIYFKLIPTDYTSERVIKSYVVKYNRKRKAKIHQYDDNQPNRFSVEINGLTWFKKSMKECKEQVIESSQFILDALDLSTTIQFVELSKPIKQ